MSTTTQHNLITIQSLLTSLHTGMTELGHPPAFDKLHEMVHAMRTLVDASLTTRIPTAADRKGRVYIAGPMTGLPDLNFPAFNAKAAELRAQGWHVENPAEHGVQEGATWADYLRHDMSQLASCEAIYMLPGWEASNGARLEHHIAQALGADIAYDTSAARHACVADLQNS